MSINHIIGRKLDQFYNAFNGKEWEIIEDSLSNSFQYFTDNCVVQNKSDFMDTMKMDDWQGVSFQISDVNITIAQTGDLAFANYKTKYEGISKEKKMIIDAIETIVFRLEEHEWKIVHLHTSNKF